MLESVPSVKLMGCFDTLECPQIVSCQIHTFWVASTKSLSNPSIMKFLSISKLKVTDTKSKK